MPITYPYLNGAKVDFAQIEMSFLPAGGLNPIPIPVPIVGFKSLDYSSEMDGQIVKGASQTPLGQTWGSLSCSASCEMYLADYQALITSLSVLIPSPIGTLAQGYMTSFFNIGINYSISDLPIITDILYGCRIKKDSSAHKQGSDALTVSFDLNPTLIAKGGLVPTNDLANLTSITLPITGL